jgi:hypothetical protein
MSLVTQIRAAIIAIAEGDAQLRALTDQASGFVRQFRDLKSARLPAIGLFVVSNTMAGGTGTRREVAVQATAVAEGNGAQTTAEAMTDRLRELLTASAFAAQSLDAVVTFDTERQDEAEAAALTARGRADLDLTLLAHTASL